MIVFDDLTLPALWDALSAESLRESVSLALREDGAACDLTTTALCDPSVVRTARVVARQSAMCAGLGLLDEFLIHAPGVHGSAAAGARDGDFVAAGTTLMQLHGPITSILPIERALLNMLGIALATATSTAQYVDAVFGTPAKVCDTRKTIPGLRWLQKYAVRCGGGHLHRMGLTDAILVKDNHITGLSAHEYADRIRQGVERVRATATPLRFVCAEADTIEQFEALLALPAGIVDIALLDNFSVDLLARAVQIRDAKNSRLVLEASGGVRLDTIRSIARTGVDRISVGAITHSSGWLDVALDIDD